MKNLLLSNMVGSPPAAPGWDIGGGGIWFYGWRVVSREREWRLKAEIENREFLIILLTCYRLLRLVQTLE